jgi:hypothetical protein
MFISLYKNLIFEQNSNKGKMYTLYLCTPYYISGIEDAL